MLKKCRSVIALLLVLACFAGCAANGNDTTTTEPTEEEISSTEFRLSTMSFNMKFEDMTGGGDPIHTWERRKSGIVECLNNYKADIVGSQELQCWQHNELMELLGETWASVGKPRNGSNTERSSIIYNTEKIEYISGETIWLSETPAVEGSKSWGSAQPRILTYGKFLHKASGTEFYYFNTHLDHHSEEARRNQLEMVVSYMDQYVADYPVILTGDFNVYITNEAFEPLTSKSDVYDNTFTPFLGELGDNMKTTHGFNGGTEGSPIDFIFYSVNSLNVESTQIIHDVHDGRYYLSDHYPVHSIITLKNTEE